MYFVFIIISIRPAGWDNLNKISILYENMHTCKAEDCYADVIVVPPQRKVLKHRIMSTILEIIPTV